MTRMECSEIKANTYDELLSESVGGRRGLISVLALTTREANYNFNASPSAYDAIIQVSFYMSSEDNTYDTLGWKITPVKIV